jgi:hypothetical protein
MALEHPASIPPTGAPLHEAGSAGTWPQPGGTFRWGRLRVVERVGRSPAAECYRARDPLLKREVLLVLRTPAEPLAQRHEHRLIVEAKRLVKVEHPALLPVLGAGMERQRAGYWKAPESGCSLLDWVRHQGVLPAAELLQLARQLGGALQALHAQLLPHGRLQPANLLRAPAEVGWVLRDAVADDWLEAKAMSPPSRIDPCCAPEQRTPATAGADERADLYALGATLLYAATGVRTPDADAWGRLAARRDLPAPLPRLLRRLLANDPMNRPLAGQLLAELELSTPWCSESDLLTRRRRRHVRWLLAAVAIGGWVCAGLLYGSR